MTSSLAGFAQVAAQAILAESSTKLHVLGTYMETADGRGYRYAKVGATATVAGKVYQGVALDATNMQPSGGLTPSANVAIGGTEITISDSITLTKDYLAGGYMSVVVTPGQGYTYRIKGNTAVSSAASCVVTLEDPLVIAITTASNVIFAKHPYDGIVIEPGTPTARIAGVPNCIITEAYYGWVQTRGACAVLFTGTGLAGKVVGSLSGGTSGSMAPAIAATNIGGEHMATGITTEYSLIYLTIG